MFELILDFISAGMVGVSLWVLAFTVKRATEGMSVERETANMLAACYFLLLAIALQVI